MNESTGSAPGQAGASPGERLRTERERKAVSVQKVAEDLHVDPWIIEALEAGRFESLGPPVYAKGYLRKYATLLGLDAEPLVADCSGQVQPVPELVRLEPAIPPRRRIRLPIRAVGIIAATLAVLAAGWWGYRLWQAHAPALGPVPVTQDEGAGDSAAAPTGSPAVQAPAADSVDVPGAQTPVRIATGPSAATSPDEVRLKLTFTADCWVELYEADGRRVFFDLGTANTARSFTMPAPLRVFLGNAAGVELEVNGEPLELPADVHRRNLAHFTLDADGRLQPAGSLARR